ncbi:TetR/AcrR family transcriptional regulator [Streptomyces sp. NPDC101225]|uniref:TetR/AcrR family transcriptional regulator n=1 Tax=Streptomyces sp. NPDC101225 TaxID=3366135 RepID=UPI00382069C2
MVVSNGKKEPVAGLRNVTRQAVRAEIAAKALDLFLEQGFEQTTVNQIAAAVGMSPRSVFRYFDTKEDMVIGGLIELGHGVADALESQPEDRTAWTALRNALQVCVEALEGEELGLRRATMLADTPALRTALLNKQLHWQRLLIPHVTQRLGGADETRELRARALVASALACLDVAATEWTRGNGSRPLGSLLDTVISAVRA